MTIHLLIIDPQNDFCDPNGSLFVPGADEDVRRLAGFIVRMRDQLDAIHVTLDSHHKVDIAHPMWWQDSAGAHPPPFTLITAADVASGRWTTTVPSSLERSRSYLRALEAGRRYPHTIWPEHCLIGDEGHNVAPELAAAIHHWEERFVRAEFLAKGSNPWTEHFSALRAEVPDPEDPTTELNTGLIRTLERADLILIAGQASTHCVMNTVADIAGAFADATHIGKLVWLTDATSPVPDPPGTTLFSDQLRRVFGALTATGMRTAATRDFLRQAAA